MILMANVLIDKTKILFAEANGEDGTVLHFQNGAVKIIELSFEEAKKLLEN